MTMQAIMETVFDVLYLTTVVFLGVRMLRTGGTNRQHRLFGLMAVTLGAGDAFHLVPRAIALCTTGLENYTAALGAGKFITSITMTVFYVLLYYVWRLRYEVKGKRGLTALVYALAAARGALMPDAHTGYGLPIGGVLAVRNAVIPYAVGVDIACRMRLTVLDMPLSRLFEHRDAFIMAIERETRFGMGAGFEKNARRLHPVMDEDWNVSPITRINRDKAWKQLGSSGGGNHFVEFGELKVEFPARIGDVQLTPGSYLALLSHSGSRGTGERVALHYSERAMSLCPRLPDSLRRLAWLDLDGEAGQEYWAAMQLMGRYASANHELIHAHVLKTLGARELTHVENHHNFAWKEEHDGESVIVHRKGATPADAGRLGIVPGSMCSPAFIVRGKGCEEALCSCSHGAGRIMSRAAAFRQLKRADMDALLKENGVELLSAGLDEAPMVYKDIHAVMAAQRDLVDILATFRPRLVKMSPDEPRRKRR